MQHLPALLAISTGASLGAVARWLLGLWLSQPPHLPWGTLAANAIGGYAIGAVLAWLHAYPGLDPLWRLLLVTGFLGGLTTFSSYSAEVFALLQAQHWWLALFWCGGQLILSLLLTALGWYSVQAWLRPTAP